MAPLPRIDRRVLRTRQLLSDAFFALLLERPYEEITVQDVTEKANLGRTTFYIHYREKEELLTASVERLIKELRQKVEPEREDACTSHALTLLVFQHVAQRRDLYQMLLGNSGPPGVAALIRQYLAEAIARNVLPPLNAEHRIATTLDLLAAHAASSLLGLIIWWLEHELSPSPEEMGHLFWRLITPGIHEVLGTPMRA